MSMLDMFELECKNCGYINYFTFTDKNIIENDCINCGKRLIFKIMEEKDKKRNKPKIKNFYTNGCIFKGHVI